MSKRLTSRWKLVLAVSVALTTTAGISALVTWQWAGNDDRAESEAEADSFEPLPDDARLQQPDPDEADDRDVYELPDHSGQLVAEFDDRRVGLPKIEADYRVDIRGDLATVEVTQRFENPTDSVVEPIYEFPLYEEAAVYGMSMEIGDRRIEAEIETSEEARRKYEEAKQRGQKAALLDQDRPNLFVQRVANVEPGQQVEITIRYTHALPRDRGRYRLTVPLAVPDRYVPSDMDDNRLVDADGEADPGAEAGGTEAGPAAPEDVSMSVRVDGGMPVGDLTSPSHPIRVGQLSETVRRVELGAGDDPTNRHFRLDYRLAGDQPRIGTNSYWNGEQDRGYFDLLVEPPADVAAEHVPNRELVFVVDRSGSMGAERMQAARDFVARTLDHLRPDDHFRVVHFNDELRRYSREPVPATTEYVDQAKRYVQNVVSSGGTEVVPALEAALGPEVPDDTIRMVVVVTDVKVGNEFEVVETINQQIGDARMFALGVGGDVNRFLLDEIGRAGRGFSRQFEVDGNVDRAVDDAVRRLQAPTLTDLSVDIEGAGATDVTPEPIPDVFEQGAVRLHGRYDQPGTHTVEVSGRLAGEDVTYTREADFTDSTHDGRAVELAWARRRIEDLMHQLNTPHPLRSTDLEGEEEIRDRIIELGLNHSLTTQWTSLVAVADPRPDDPAASDDNPPEAPPAGEARRRERRAPSPDSSGSADGDSGTSHSIVMAPEDLGDPSPESRVVVPDINVEGDIESRRVRELLGNHRDELEVCHDSHRGDDPQLQTIRLEVRWSISRFGDVQEARVVESPDPEFEQCLTDEIEDLNFLARNDDGPARVETTLEFTVSD